MNTRQKTTGFLLQNSYIKLKGGWWSLAEIGNHDPRLRMSVKALTRYHSVEVHGVLEPESARAMLYGDSIEGGAGRKNSGIH